MPFNADGSYTGSALSGSGPGEAPDAQPVNGSVGYSDNGQLIWNPTGGPDGKGAYERPTPANTASSASGNGVGTAQAGVGGWSDGTGDPTNGYASGAAPTTLGKAAAWSPSMGRSAGAWGGYAGTYVQGPSGAIVYDAGQNGANEAIQHAQGLANAAWNQQTPQINYDTANGFAGMDTTDRGTQLDAMNLTAQTANGQNLQSVALGNQMLQQGAQAQQAAAASTRGDALSRAAAGNQVTQGLGAYNAQGQTQIQANAANEMANARQAYMQQATALRGSDAAAQSQQQQQIAAQQQMELGQRQLNQGTALGYEAQAQNVTNAATDAALSADEIAHGYDATQSARSTAKADRQLQTYGAAASAAGTGAAKLGDAIFGGSSSSSGSDNNGGMDPYSAAVSASDERAKVNIRGLGGAAAARYWKGGR